MKRPAAMVMPLLLATMLGGCGAGADRVMLTGRVVAGPTCPVEGPSLAPSCADRAVEGAILAIRGDDGVEVTRVTADVDGRFSVALPAGTYAVVPQSVQGLLGTAPPMEIELRTGEPPPEMTVTYDTGIR